MPWISLETFDIIIGFLCDTAIASLPVIFIYISIECSFTNLGKFLTNTGTKIDVQQITKQKDGVSPFYNTLSKSPIYDWCEVMENAETNPIYKLLVEFFGNVAPEIMHKCPYWGSVTAFNLTFNMDKFFTFYSPGVYKNILFIFDDVDSEIFKLRIYTRVF
ncbi:hypothetical protein PVAND_009591 [Polypedilum vanderplanki]|uniref:Uncharacterized protein n=1 Tax=Polypedilum vanderplanki TaxID=319348 RepID=A0A9J6CDN7_POLVA|nr:hypothetical protein PVAND_009591 [Polypedilum vanderplanki]